MCTFPILFNVIVTKKKTKKTFSHLVPLIRKNGSHMPVSKSANHYTIQNILACTQQSKMI